MASSDIDYESFSDEDIPEPTESFRPADLPFISTPNPYDSDTSSSSDSKCIESPTSPSTPTTPASPATSLGLLSPTSATRHKPLTITYFRHLNLSGRDL